MRARATDCCHSLRTDVTIVTLSEFVLWLPRRSCTHQRLQPASVISSLHSLIWSQAMFWSSCGGTTRAVCWNAAAGTRKTTVLLNVWEAQALCRPVICTVTVMQRWVRALRCRAQPVAAAERAMQCARCNTDLGRTFVAETHFCNQHGMFLHTLNLHVRVLAS